MENKTRTGISQAACACLVLFTAGCASIFSRSRYQIPLRSNVDGTLVTVRDRSGNICATERTPATVTLKSGSGYFSRGKYTFTFEKAGYYSDTQQLSAQMSGWYFGNLIIGGLPGLVIIDPITGAMFNLDETPVNAHLVCKPNQPPPIRKQTTPTVAAPAPTLQKQPTPVSSAKPLAPVIYSSPSAVKTPAVPVKSVAPVTPPPPPAGQPPVSSAKPVAPVTSSPPPAGQPPAAPVVRAIPAATVPAATASSPCPAVPSPGLSGTVEKLKQLRDAGTITQEEYETLVLRVIQKKGKE
ncbi:MAG: SHOCT domain-containing protein [Kiritimatiellae bacterium]|nr:SHOCT domain-containing protein [Kiritimatiellia bacterium]